MKKRYITLIIIGIILTEMAHKIATAQRGYDAIGGEIFMLPLLLFMGLAVDEGKAMIEEIKETFKEGDDGKWKQKERASSTTRC
jgi:F0F1-type ATP synthase assembly protein I